MKLKMQLKTYSEILMSSFSVEQSSSSSTQRNFSSRNPDSKSTMSMHSTNQNKFKIRWKIFNDDFDEKF